MARTIAFEDKISYEPNTGCWLWEGHIDKDGYGTHTVNRAPVRAHRFSYEKYKNLIQPGLVIDHLCKTRSCVNPDHVEPVTVTENNRRIHRNKTHCINGHPYTTENVVITKAGTRRCNACRRKA